jgi:hypothetical protein
MLKKLNGQPDVLFLHIKDAQVVEYGTIDTIGVITFFDVNDNQIYIIKKDSVVQKGSIKPFKSYVSDGCLFWKFSHAEYKHSDRSTKLFHELYLEKKVKISNPNDLIFPILEQWIEKEGREIGTMNVMNNTNDKNDKYVNMQLFTKVTEE